MREQLSQYVGLLFAGTTGMDDIRQEILQNSLDRFDDLVAQGKTPEAAYRLTISGIGDINEILGQAALRSDDPPHPAAAAAPPSDPTPAPAEPESSTTKLMRSIAIALYILCAIPVIFLEEIGLCITLILVAVATGILVYIGKDDPESESTSPETAPVQPTFPPAPKKKSKGLRIASTIIWLTGIAAYIALSFATKGWYITWLIFPMTACVRGVARGIFDLKEACRK